MFKPCPYCNKKSPHNHKKSNDHNGKIEKITPIKKDPNSKRTQRLNKEKVNGK